MASGVIQYDQPTIVLYINVLKCLLKVSMSLIFSFYDKLYLVLPIRLVLEYHLLCVPHKMGKYPNYFRPLRFQYVAFPRMMI